VENKQRGYIQDKLRSTIIVGHLTPKDAAISQSAILIGRMACSRSQFSVSTVKDPHRIDTSQPGSWSTGVWKQVHRHRCQSHNPQEAIQRAGTAHGVVGCYLCANFSRNCRSYIHLSFRIGEILLAGPKEGLSACRQTFTTSMAAWRGQFTISSVQSCSYSARILLGQDHYEKQRRAIILVVHEDAP
jgi:hypothetical protein